MFTATANRVGVEERAPRPRLSFTGRSVVAAPDGQVLAEASANGTALLQVEAETERARDKRLPSGDDRLRARRPERYGALLGEVGSDV